MGDMDRRKWALSFTVWLMPKEPPTRKVRSEAPSTIQLLRRCASCGLSMVLPSMHMATTLPPLGSLARIAAPSRSKAAWIWAWVGRSGSRSSGSSVTVRRQYPPRRLAYSAAASR